jgi:hypothetical protein
MRMTIKKGRKAPSKTRTKPIKIMYTGLIGFIGFICITNTKSYALVLG